MTDAKTSGPKISIATEPSTISATKSAPAMGALYADAMPAAAPQPTSRRSRGVDHFCKRPASDATRDDKLHERTFATDRAAGSDRKKRGQTFR